jgi:hypothetical protein
VVSSCSDQGCANVRVAKTFAHGTRSRRRGAATTAAVQKRQLHESEHLPMVAARMAWQVHILQNFDQAARSTARIL